MWNKTKDIDPATERKLESLFTAYKSALPDVDAGVNFMPDMWRKIEARQQESHFFTRMSRALVTAAVAASVLAGILLSASNYQSMSYFNGTYIEALSAWHNSQLDQFHPDQVAGELEQQ